MHNSDQRVEPTIQWDYPEPKSALDRFVGPGATRAELALQFIPAGLAAMAWVGIAILQQWGWSVLQLVLAGILMVDMVGGVATNATSSAKRWYHRPGQGVGAHLGFTAVHAVQPLVVTLLFDRGNWAFLVGSYGYLMVAALTILLCPLYLRRPLAGSLLVGGFFLALYVLPVPSHFEWFLPVYYTKLLMSHLLREEPYRPDLERTS